MTYKEISSALASAGIPCAYYQFADETELAPPFMCFYYTGSDDFIADNANYGKIDRLIVELYTDNKDFALEETIQTILNGAGLVYTKNESYIDSERMYMVVYETDAVITEETT